MARWQTTPCALARAALLLSVLFAGKLAGHPIETLAQAVLQLREIDSQRA